MQIVDLDLEVNIVETLIIASVKKMGTKDTEGVIDTRIIFIL